MKAFGFSGLQGSYVELAFWIIGLMLLGCTAESMSGSQELHHFTLCPVAGMGLEGCPGCGIGRSIGQALKGNLKESFDYHWFGIPAILIIFYRIYLLSSLLWRNIKIKKQKV